MRLLFRKVRPDEVEQELTQRDQFNTDEVGLTETLVREAHQNSLDAGGQSGCVRTRFAIIEPNPMYGKYWGEILSPLKPHLSACGIDTQDIDLRLPRLLVIEDFGTTGLRGEWDKKDKGDFSDFWRRVGLSHKGGTQGGRWGLGKLVFSSSSRIRTFFGLTVRDNDAVAMPLLMGQAVLVNHKVDGAEYAPHGFFSETKEDGFQIPVTDPSIINQFSLAAGFSRINEPGLSIAIPFAQDDLTTDGLIPLIVRNYFFPILTGQLQVEVGSRKITADTFEELASQFGGATLADGHLIRFIEDLESSRSGLPEVTLGEGWASDMEGAIEKQKLEDLREAFSQQKLIHVRAPVKIRRKSGATESTHFDLFLRRADDGVQGQGLFIRGPIVLPGEAPFFRTRQAFGAFIATDPNITAFLGDAENPAHTRWNGRAEKLTKNWRNPTARLREIRGSLNSLYELITRAVDRLEPDALINLLSIEKSGVDQLKKKRDPVIKPPIIPQINRRPALYSIVRRKGGFAIKGASVSSDSFPLQIKVRAAYDLIRGNPFKKHSPFDFDFTKDDFKISEEGATCVATAANELLVEAADPAFWIEISGFDENRDLLVRATV